MFCQKCGNQMEGGSKYCLKCGTPSEPTQTVVVNDASGLEALIPHNALALWAYYLGIFSLICGITAIPALITGIFGLRYAAQHPEAKGAVHAWVGVIMGGIMILLLIFVLLASWGNR